MARWSDEQFVPGAEAAAEADLAIEALRRRGSPSHDGLAARLVGYGEVDGRLELDLQPLRWALRLVPGDAAGSISALCVTRAHDGRWLAGRRAAWLSQWAGRWTLGAGGAVDLGESPAQTLERELVEEWSRDARAADRRGAGPSSPRDGHDRRARLAASPARRSAPTTSTTTSPGGRPTSATGRRRPATSCAGWPGRSPDAAPGHHLQPAEGRLVRCTRRLRHPADRLARPRAARRRVRLRHGARHRLDRHVARLPGGRAHQGRSPCGSRSRWRSSGGIGPFFGTAEFVREGQAAGRPRSSR